MPSLHRLDTLNMAKYNEHFEHPMIFYLEDLVRHKIMNQSKKNEDDEKCLEAKVNAAAADVNKFWLKSIDEKKKTMQKMKVIWTCGGVWRFLNDEYDGDVTDESKNLRMMHCEGMDIDRLPQLECHKDAGHLYFLIGVIIQSWNTTCRVFRT